MERDSFDSLLDGAPVLEQPTTRGELFLPASHMRLLEKLEHLSRYSHFLQVVVGLPGSGKSTLVKQFLPAADEADLQACLIRAKGGVTVAQLLRQLVEQLQLDTAAGSSNAELFKGIIAHARALAQIPRLFLIVVDDAEELSEAALGVLFKLQEQFADPEARPHMVLFGGPRLKELLKGELFQRVMGKTAHVMELEPLSFDEMQGFIDHRFGPDAGALGERELKQLYNDTFGLPGRIPEALERLLEGELDETPAAATPRRGALSRRLVLIVAVLLLPLAGAGFWFAQQEVGETRLRVELPTPAAVERAPVAEPAPVVIEETLEQRLDKVRQALEQEQAAQVVSAPAAPISEPTAVASVAQLPTAPVRETSAAVQAPPKRVLALPPPTTATGSTDGEIVSSPEGVDEAGQPAGAVIEPPAKPGSEQVLLGWDAAGYTLQMLGARQEPSVAKFISQQRNPELFYYFSTIYKEKPWYVVVYGNYPDRATAVAAVADLPLELRKRRPWARSIEGVQNDIRRKK